MATQSDFQLSPRPETGRRYFTLDQANRAVPYVARIMDDVRASYRKAVELQQRLDRPLPGDEQASVQDDYERSVDELNRYVDELHDVGVELKDYDMGLIDFPAMHEGREVCLCWRVGEEKVVAWHEVNVGFSGRKDVSELGS
jgi:hypothetical protein